MLTIEKIVKLLDDFHFDVFRDHVKELSIRSLYPLALIDVISREIEQTQDSDTLCRAVYGASDEKTKKKFFQLSHHTYHLTAFLSKNYPTYLQPNLTRVQQLINSSQLDKGITLLQALLDISKKIEDFSTEILANQIMVQHNLLLESLKTALQYQMRISKLVANQKDINDIYTHFYSFYNLKEKDKSEAATITNHKKFYASFFDHSATVIQIISRYCYCYFLHYNRLADFYKDSTLSLINEIEQLLNKNKTIIFPFLLDLHHRVGFLKLKFWNDKGETDQVSVFIPELLKNSPDLKYWSSYVNSPEIVILIMQGNLFSRKHLRLHDITITNDSLSQEAKNQLQIIRSKIQKFLDNSKFQNDYTLRYITLCTIDGLLSLIDGKEQIEAAIENLNHIFKTYQHLPFLSFNGSIYSILITAYFKLRDFEKVDATFKRYKKQLKDQAVHPVNDLSIHAIYYTSMWQITKKSQYAKKFEKIYLQTKENVIFVDLHENLNYLIEHYNIQISYD